MTDSNYTAICLVVDRSGSMGTIRAAMDEAINGYFDHQRAATGKRTIRVCQFDTEYDVVFPSTPAATAPLYALSPRGGTALWDAIGRGVTEFGEELNALPESERPGQVLFTIVTDGRENSSREWTAPQVKWLVERQQQEWNWKFLYLGANQDAVLTGQAMGLDRDSTMTYTASSAGGQAAMRTFRNYTEAVAVAAVGPFITDEEREKAMDQ